MSITIHSGKLQSPYFEFIQNGEKIYELRVNDAKRREMKVGDIWIFSHNDNKSLKKIKIKIIEKRIYKSFEEAIQDTGYLNLLPNAKSIEEAIEIYNSFGSYKEDSKLYGVVLFKLELI